jgi:hypothetical protein
MNTANKFAPRNEFEIGIIGDRRAVGRCPQCARHIAKPNAFFCVARCEKAFRAGVPLKGVVL